MTIRWNGRALDKACPWSPFRNYQKTLHITCDVSPMRDISRRSPSPPRIDSVRSNMRQMPNATRFSNYQEAWTISYEAYKCPLYSGTLEQPILCVSRNYSTKPISSTRRLGDTLPRKWLISLPHNETMTLQFRLVDKYGDNGLVSAMILQPASKLPEVFEIDNWVMSCRVFGRQLEFEALNIAVEQARRRGIKAFRAAYIPTSKNGVISELYPSLGFSPVSDGMPRNGATCWFLDLAEHISRSTHISRSGQVT